MNLIAKIKRRLFRPSETIDGYDHPELVDVIFRKTLAYEPQGEWPEMRGVASVLDFGGGAGKHYKEAKSASVRWAVVETAAMVDRAKELATNRLQFFTDISEAARWLGDVDAVHSNGAVQYTQDPISTVQALCRVKAKKMLWSRVLLSPSPQIETQSSYLCDNGPPAPIDHDEKIVRFTRAGVSETAFLSEHDCYELEARGPDWFQFRLREGSC